MANLGIHLRSQKIRAEALVLALTAVLAGLATAQPGRATEFKEAWMKVEFNASDEDIGVQFFMDAEGWRATHIFDPQGRQMWHGWAGGPLLEQGGGTELFLESVEPTLDELSIAAFLARFPAGVYRFVGRARNGVRIVTLVEFDHEIPAGPEIVSPPQDDECPVVALPLVIEWEPVTTTIFGDPIVIEKYQVIVENDANFDVIVPAEAGTELTVSPELLVPGQEYDFEILAIAEDDGNQTITQGCFVVEE